MLINLTIFAVKKMLLCKIPCYNKNPFKMKLKTVILPAAIALSSLVLYSSCSQPATKDKSAAAKDTTKKAATAAVKQDTVVAPVVYPPIDNKLYDSLMKKLANGDTTGKWPVKNAPYPLPGAILP